MGTATRQNTWGPESGPSFIHQERERERERESPSSRVHKEEKAGGREKERERDDTICERRVESSREKHKLKWRAQADSQHRCRDESVIRGEICAKNTGYKAI